MRAGEVVASKYELVSRVGQGGMGAVWRVAHLSTGREFAIKFLHAAVATSEDSRQRFLQEAKASARINHPNIIDIFDVGETEDGTLYLVMELLDGISLGEALRSQPPFNARELLLVLAEACTALIAAHLAGVIHRDIKPPNIFLHRDRGTGFVTAKVLDFGVSKVLSGDDGVSTHTGSLLGSPRYMSPEQAHSAASADGRSDVWSVGVVLFEALTGRFPHDGDSSNNLIVAIATRPPKRIDSVAPQLPLALRLLVDDCLKPQNERVQSAESLLDRILVILATHDLSDIPLAMPTVAKGKVRVRPESFILRTSPESIPGLATSMMRGRALSPPVGSSADTPRLERHGASSANPTLGEEATLVRVVDDPSTHTLRQPELPRRTLDQEPSEGNPPPRAPGAWIPAPGLLKGAEQNPSVASLDPTVESISSINVARGASYTQPEAFRRPEMPFASGAAQKTRALWALLAVVLTVTIAVSTALVMSFSRGSPEVGAAKSPGAVPTVPVASAEKASLASTPLVEAASSSATPSSAAPESNSASPTTSVSALPSVQHLPKPAGSGGGKRPTKTGDPIKDLGSGLN